jgi:hypothetical protein
MAGERQEYPGLPVRVGKPLLGKRLLEQACHSQHAMLQQWRCM